MSSFPRPAVIVSNDAAAQAEQIRSIAVERVGDQRARPELRRKALDARALDIHQWHAMAMQCHAMATSDQIRAVAAPIPPAVLVQRTTRDFTGGDLDAYRARPLRTYVFGPLLPVPRKWRRRDRDDPGTFWHSTRGEGTAAWTPLASSVR